MYTCASHVVGVAGGWDIYTCSHVVGVAGGWDIYTCSHEWVWLAGGIIHVQSHSGCGRRVGYIHVHSNVTLPLKVYLHVTNEPRALSIRECGSVYLGKAISSLTSSV